LEIWKIGDDMIINMETAISSISNKVWQLRLVQEKEAKRKEVKRRKSQDIASTTGQYCVNEITGNKANRFFFLIWIMLPVV
jgi:hypothetical protein